MGDLLNIYGCKLNTLFYLLNLEPCNFIAYQKVNIKILIKIKIMICS